VIFEVLSPDTEALDRREKRLAYQGIPTLHTYVLVAQDKRELTIYRRGDNGWTRELLPEQGNVLRLPQIDFEIGLDAIYDRVGV
jgi:Uma2 family endonuclease